MIDISILKGVDTYYIDITNSGMQEGSVMLEDYKVTIGLGGYHGITHSKGSSRWKKRRGGTEKSNIPDKVELDENNNVKQKSRKDVIREIQEDHNLPDGDPLRQQMNKRVHEWEKENQKLTQQKHVRRRRRGERSKENILTSDEVKARATIDDAPTCPYCGILAQIKTIKEVGARQNGKGNYAYWVCTKCTDVSVTTIKNSPVPSGIMADKELRGYRREIHQLLDEFKRAHKGHNELKDFIAEKLGKRRDDSAIGKLTKDEIRQLALWVNREKAERRWGYIFDEYRG